MPKTFDLKLPKERVMSAPASVHKRILAFIVDFILLQLVIFGPFAPVLEARIPKFTGIQENYKMIESNPDLINDLAPIFFAMFFVMFLYFTIFEYKLLQTPGKMLFGLKLECIEKKNPVSLMQVMIRNAVILVFFPLWFLCVIDVGYLLFTGSRLSDRVSRTQIIEEVVI